jgi:hypothetical protein
VGTLSKTKEDTLWELIIYTTHYVVQWIWTQIRHRYVESLVHNEPEAVKTVLRNCERLLPNHQLKPYNNNNPWRYSSDEPWPAEQPPLAVFPDCTRPNESLSVTKPRNPVATRLCFLTPWPTVKRQKPRHGDSGSSLQTPVLDNKPECYRYSHRCLIICKLRDLSFFNSW